MVAPVHFIELDIFGVYIAPMAAMMVAAYVMLLPLRWLGLTLGLLQRVWHPALLQIAVYVLILSTIVLVADGVGMSTLMPAP